MNNERVVYLNGEFLPESRAFVHFRDRGFIYGDAVFDTARTFGGKIFRLDAHIDRLFDSLSYLRIDPGLTRSEFAALSEQVVSQNRHLLGPNDDYWIFQRVTRGSNLPDGPGAPAGPTVIIECTPLPFAARAVLFREGVEVTVPSVRRTPPESLSPNAKMHNYLNFVVGQFEAPTDNPRAWPVLLDTRGFIAEGNGSNVFLVKNGVVSTPKREYVLAGISRQIVIELCESAGFECREADLTMYDAAIADEIFITSTSLCICPVRLFNGQAVGTDATIPGPVTRRLTDGFSQLVDYDYVGQYLAHG